MAKVTKKDTSGLNDLARINNYFFRRVLKKHKGFPIDWATGLAMSHARTLLAAYRHRDLFLQDEDGPPTSDIEAVNSFVEKSLAATGWLHEVYHRWKAHADAVDIDMEALILLEMRIFDRSEDTRITGNHQRGLDVSMHQDSWHAWSSDGMEGYKQVHKGNESELEVRPKFDTEVLAQWYRAELEKEEEKMRSHKVTCPKPRMLSRHTGKRRALDDIRAGPCAVRSGSPNKDTAPPANAVQEISEQYKS